MTLMIVASKRLMRREEAAAYLGLSAARFDALKKDGRLPSPSPLSALYGYAVWDRADLDRWVDLHGGATPSASRPGPTPRAGNPYAHLEGRK